MRILAKTLMVNSRYSCFVFNRLKNRFIHNKLAGAERFELPTCGFGDRCTTNCATLLHSGLNFAIDDPNRQIVNYQKTQLLGFFVNRAFPIKFTEFFDLETAGHIPFFFRAGIVPAFTFCTFQNNQFTHFQASGRKTGILFHCFPTAVDVTRGFRQQYRKQRCGRLRG